MKKEIRERKLTGTRENGGCRKGRNWYRRYSRNRYKRYDKTGTEGMAEMGVVSVAWRVAVGIPTSTAALGSLGVFAIKENGHTKQRETAAEG